MGKKSAHRKRSSNDFNGAPPASKPRATPVPAYKKRSVGVQSIVPTKHYESPYVLSMKNLEKNEYSRLFYAPHSLLLLLFIIVMNVYTLYKLDEDASTERVAKT